MIKRADLIDPELFGNEAGEDEPINILTSYFVEKDDFKRFYDPNTRISIVKAKKGLGKSALLKKSQADVAKSMPSAISIYLKGSHLAELMEIPDRSPNGLINGWQQRICSKINLEIGRRMKVAISDSAISLVESAELAGFRDRNLLGALLDRLKFRSLPVDQTKLMANDNFALLTRHCDDATPSIWLYVDDIDATFINTPENRLAISTFFSACRDLVTSVRGLNIRVSVRTDVWSILEQHDEAMDKVRQYIFDVSWSNAEFREILCRKILGFFQRRYPDDPRFSENKIQGDPNIILGYIFFRETPIPVNRPIFVYSDGRPRWAAHLCKLAAKQTHSRSGNLITDGDIGVVLDAYGTSRLADLYKEHNHQFPRLKNLIESFARGSSRYTTSALLNHITKQFVGRYGTVVVDGQPHVLGSMGFAHFLYRIGFIYARDDKAATGLDFIRFEDKPNLLTTNENPDDGLDWDINPSFAKTLRIGI